ncbi:hypothetical protein J6590_033425 [Homalodisca vitripennis]|nr:hypothetical protein J6590_033425 [Homalodisca vitripennis]
MCNNSQVIAKYLTARRGTALTKPSSTRLFLTHVGTPYKVLATVFERSSSPPGPKDMSSETCPQGRLQLTWWVQGREHRWANRECP